jgi:hypothetical protein
MSFFTKYYMHVLPGDEGVGRFDGISPSMLKFILQIF